MHYEKNLIALVENIEYLYESSRTGKNYKKMPKTFKTKNIALHFTFLF